MKKSLALMLALIMVLCMIPTTAFAANGTGHQISVKIYKVVLDSSKPLGYQNPELVNTITVICQDATGHSGYNHSVYLKEFHPTKVGLSTTDWTGWQFDLYYTKGKDNGIFYDWKKDTVNATANVEGSEPYSCSKNFYLVYKEAAPQTRDITLTYDANGGSGAPGHETQKVEKGQSATFTVSALKPTRENYTFKGWSTDENAATADYNGGDKITISQNTTLYAVWEENNPTPPTTDKPEPPKPENTPGIPGLTGAEVVNVKCTTNSSHAKKSYPLIADSYDVGNVEGDATSGYTCTITVKPGEYVNAYNGTYPEHTLVGPENHTINLKWNENKWKVDSGVPVVFDVKCDKTQPPLDGNITIEVSKVWDDGSNKPEQITVQLWANGKEVGQPATIMPDNEDTWFHRFNNMPAKDSNGNLINYTVTEENVPAGWTPYYWTADKLIFRIHNVPTESTREIKVTKKVSGEGADKEKYFDFKVTLFQDLDGNGEIGVGTHPLSDTYTFGGVTFTNGVATFKLKDGDSKEITGIPSHVQYLPLLYKVEEIAPNGYTVKVNDSAGSSINGDFAGDNKTVNIAFENVKESGTNPTPTPGGGNGGGGHYHPTTTPVPVIVIPPKTGDMTIWQSILHFLGIR